MNIPFSQWTKEQVCGWLEDYGLGHYVSLSRQWVESGQTLLSASPQEIEKVRQTFFYVHNSVIWIVHYLIAII